MAAKKATRSGGGKRVGRRVQRIVLKKPSSVTHREWRETSQRRHAIIRRLMKLRDHPAVRRNPRSFREVRNGIDLLVRQKEMSLSNRYRHMEANLRVAEGIIEAIES